MPNEIQLKRRVSGAAGAPAGLKSGEAAWNMVDNVVYGGFGDNGSGDATSVVAIAGPGAFVGSSGDQSIAGVKTFAASPIVPTPTPGDNSGAAASTAYVDSALSGTSYTAGDGIAIAAGEISVDATIARLADPAFTGSPTAPTAAAGNSSTLLATTAFVAAEIAALIGSAPGALDSIQELAAALNDNPNQIADILTAQAGKLTAANDLSDLNDVATARSNLGLGDMAVQNASAVAITGGTIDGISLDGGTF